MKEAILVHGAPELYRCDSASWLDLPSLLEDKGWRCCFLLTGEKAWQVAVDFMPDLSAFEVNQYVYQGECSDAEMERCREQLSQLTDVVIAVGGGKICDLAKMLANQHHLPVITMPTLASTCAAYTPLSVVYYENGDLQELRYLKQGVAAVLINPVVLLHSPVDLLVAGIGDTLAKWYEAESILSQQNNLPVPLKVAYFAAQQCRDELLIASLSAINDLKQQQLSPAFQQVIETNIMLAGMVGGFGDHLARSSGAHAIHDALCSVAASHDVLHGKKVAYGILVQLAMLECWDEIERLKIFYRQIGLPCSLQEMGIDSDVIQSVAQIAMNDPAIHLLPMTVDSNCIQSAMKLIEVS